MNSFTNSSNTNLFTLRRQRLETLLDQSANTAYSPSRLGTFLQQVGQGVVHWMTTGSMPKVARYMQGDTEVWKVYDPTTNHTVYFDHEEAVRTWMEQRYYQ